jgi:hypothetical protein
MERSAPAYGLSRSRAPCRIATTEIKRRSSSTFMTALMRKVPSGAAQRAISHDGR